MTDAEQGRWTVGGLTLSGLQSHPADDPVGTVLALHGGGYSAGYWDAPHDPDASLLRLGAQLGYRVVAPDRPGYGATHGLVGADVRIARQAQVVAKLVEQLAGPGFPVYLVGHSMGAILAVHTAAAAPSGLAGVDISGLPFIFEAESLTSQLPLDRLDFLPELTWPQARGLFYGPDGTFAPGTEHADRGVARPNPAAEIIDAYDCNRAIRELAPSVRVPVQLTRAEFEVSSDGGTEGLLESCSLFTASPRVVPVVQVGSGHNISLHRVARAHHLRALTFFEELRAQHA